MSFHYLRLTLLELECEALPAVPVCLVPVGDKHDPDPVPVRLQGLVQPGRAAPTKDAHHGVGEGAVQHGQDVLAARVAQLREGMKVDKVKGCLNPHAFWHNDVPLASKDARIVDCVQFT